MILRRIAQGIKDQDWFVVSVEIMIVVIGIFIGLQVDDWNEDRKDDGQAKLTLERLHQDFISIDSSSEYIRNIYTDLSYSTSRVITFLGSDHPLSDEYSDDEFQDDLDAMYSGTGPLQRSPTYMELVSGGKMHLIRDEELRTALAEFDEHVTRTLNVYPIFHDMQMRYGEHINKYIVLDDKLADEFESGEIYTRVVYDLEGLRADATVLPAITMIRRAHLYNRGWQVGLKKRSEEVLRLLERNLSQ